MGTESTSPAEEQVPEPRDKVPEVAVLRVNPAQLQHLTALVDAGIGKTVNSLADVQAAQDISAILAFGHQQLQP